MAGDFVNLAVLGHVDHGKSTLVGRLFDECGQIPQRVMARLQRLAESLGQPALRFAFFTDTSLEERRHRISIEVAYRRLETPQHIFNVIDVPGHKDYMRNAISGVWGADAAVLVVDASVSTAGGLAPQTKEHLILLKALDVAPVLVAVNKMDAVAYGREAFELCKLQVEEFCHALHYPAGSQATFLPLAAAAGDNVAAASVRLPWYEGPSLLEALDALPPLVPPSHLPLRMPLLRTFSVRGVGSVVTGTVASGQLAVGDEVLIAPYPGTGSTRAEVKSIERQHEQVASAVAGDDVGVLLTKHDRSFVARMVKKGAVLGSPDCPPVPARRFRAAVQVVGRRPGIRAGYAPHLHIHQASTPCRIAELVVGDKDSAESEATRLADGETGVAWIETERPIVIERAGDHPRLGRFLLRDGPIAAIGQCLEIGAAAGLGRVEPRS